MNSSSDRDIASGEAVRFDQNGEKIYDSSVRNTRSEDMGGSRSYSRDRDDTYSRTYMHDRDDTNSRANMRDRDDMNSRSNMRDRDDHRMGQGRDSGDMMWNDHGMTMVREADLPQPARSAFMREANGNAITETGWTTTNGKTCYCAKTTKNGVTYKMMSDADGNMLGTKRME